MTCQKEAMTTYWKRCSPRTGAKRWGRMLRRIGSMYARGLRNDPALEPGLLQKINADLRIYKINSRKEMAKSTYLLK